MWFIFRERENNDKLGWEEGVLSFVIGRRFELFKRYLGKDVLQLVGNKDLVFCRGRGKLDYEIIFFRDNLKCVEEFIFRKIQRLRNREKVEF